MKLQSMQFLHESTGITFAVVFEDGKKHITIQTSHGEDEFIFQNSKPETLIKIGLALLDIGKFCDIIRSDGVCKYSDYLDSLATPTYVGRATTTT